MTTPLLNPRRTVADLGMVFGSITASIAFVMELTLLPLILGDIQRDLNLSLRELSWVFNAYAVAVAAAVLTTGVIGDRVNKRHLFGFGVLMFAAGSLFAAASSNFTGLILSRTLQGIGGGLFSPLVPILLTHAFPARSGRILMIWGGLAGVAATILPTIGDAIEAAFGWRALFISFAMASLVAILLTALSNVKAFPVEKKGNPNYRSLFPRRGIWPILAFIFLTYGSFTFYLFYLPTRLETDSASVAWVLTFVWLSFSTFSFVLREKLEGANLYRILMAAPILIASGFLLAVAFQGTPQAQFLSAILVGAGLACGNSPSTHLLLRLTPVELRAFSSSLDITCARCGGAMTVALFSGVGPLVAASTITGLSLLAVLCCGFFAPARS